MQKDLGHSETLDSKANRRWLTADDCLKALPETHFGFL